MTVFLLEKVSFSSTYFLAKFSFLCPRVSWLLAPYWKEATSGTRRPLVAKYTTFCKRSALQSSGSSPTRGEFLPPVCKDGILSLVTPKRCRVLLQRCLPAHTPSTALLMASRKQNQPRCPPTDRRTIKLWSRYVCNTYLAFYLYTYIMEIYSTMKKSEICG